jgi:hypothetical protein
VVAQSVQCLPTDWTAGVRSLTEAEDFFSNLCVQTGSGAHPASCTVGTGGSLSGGKARPGRDADHSPPSSAEVKKELELYLLSPKAPPWRVAGPLYLYLLLLTYTYPKSRLSIQLFRLHTWFFWITKQQARQIQNDQRQRRKTNPWQNTMIMTKIIMSSNLHVSPMNVQNKFSFLMQS